MNELEVPVIESNYPRKGNIQQAEDTGRMRGLIDAYYQCNYAVIAPILGFLALLGVGSTLLTNYPFGFRVVYLFISLMTMAIVYRPATTYAEAKGLNWIQKWLYILGSALSTPFCVGFLVVAALQNGIYKELVRGGLISNNERLNRKRAETVLKLSERNQRM